jgi:hypothetical protein
VAHLTLDNLDKLVGLNSCHIITRALWMNVIEDTAYYKQLLEEGGSELLELTTFDVEYLTVKLAVEAGEVENFSALVDVNDDVFPPGFHDYRSGEYVDGCSGSRD